MGRRDIRTRVSHAPKVGLMLMAGTAGVINSRSDEAHMMQ